MTDSSHIYLSDFAKTWSLGFRQLDEASALKPRRGRGGEKAPSRIAWALVGCLGSSCQTQGGEEGVFYWRPLLFRLWVFSVKLPCYWLCFWLCQCIVEPYWGVLCWHGTLLEWVIPSACVKGQSPSRGGAEDLWPSGFSLRHCGHVFANSVRYIYTKFSFIVW